MIVARLTSDSAVTFHSWLRDIAKAREESRCFISSWIHNRRYNRTSRYGLFFLISLGFSPSPFSFIFAMPQALTGLTFGRKMSESSLRESPAPLVLIFRV